MRREAILLCVCAVCGSLSIVMMLMSVSVCAGPCATAVPVTACDGRVRWHRRWSDCRVRVEHDGDTECERVRLHGEIPDETKRQTEDW